MFSSIFGTKVFGATVIIVVDMELPNYFFYFLVVSIIATV
jgi:hypothetical protein